LKERASKQERKELAMKWLEEMLGPIPQVVASRIPEDAIRDFYSDYEDDWQLLLDRVRGLLGVYEDRPASAGAAKTGRGKELRGTPQEIMVELDGDTNRRGEVFSEVAVALAEQRPDVRRFRRSYLRDGLLTTEEADAFLDGRDTGRSTLDRRITAQGTLRWRARTLSLFYGWRARDAAHFVLTGNEPVYRPVRVAVAHTDSTRPFIPNTPRIVITSDVWVDAREVARVFRDAQRQLLGGDNRKVPDRVLEVARFVARRIREQDGKETWNEWWREWNEEHPVKYPKGWRYSAPHGFKQAFERFVHPKNRRPKWKRRDTN
jgi:hypothetical protein